MSRRILSAILALGLCQFGALAQSYQTQFAEQKFDRSKGPGTFHSGVEVEAATGHVTLNLPLGPGIGTRGLKYQPALAGRWAPQAAMENYWYEDPAHPGTYLALENQKNSYGGGFSLTPGSLSLIFDGDGFDSGSNIPNSKPHVVKLTNYTSPDGFSGTLDLESADPGALPSLAEAQALMGLYGFQAGWDVAWMPYTSNTTPSQRFVRRGVSGELVIGLVHSTLSPLRQAVDFVAADGGATGIGSNTQENCPWYPTTVLVIHGDMATVFSWASDRYDKVDPHAGMKDPVVRSYYAKANYYYMRHASFRVSAVRNRFGDEIRFTTTGKQSFRAECFNAGTSLGIAVNVSPTQVSYEGSGAQPSYSFQLAGANAPRSGPRATDGTALVTTPYTYPTYAGFRASLDLSYPQAYDGFKDQLLTALTDNTSQETVGLTYSYIAGSGDVGIQAPSVIDIAGRKVSLTWTRYEFFNNMPNLVGLSPNQDLATFSGGSAQAGFTLLPAYCYGVTKVVDEQILSVNTYGTDAQRITEYTRVVPTPTRKSGSLWTNTSFYVITKLPGGGSTLTRYQEPLPTRTALESDVTVAEKIQTLAYLKHQVAEMRSYPAGADANADVIAGTTPGQPYLKDPSISAAHKVELYDRWDLRSSANPSGDFNRASVPQATRSRSWDALNKVLRTSESLDWDSTNLGWRHALTRIESTSTPPAGNEIQSLFDRGVSYASPAGTDIIERFTERNFETQISNWILGRGKDDCPYATVDTSQGRAASVAAPSAATPFTAPKTTQVADTLKPELNRVKSVVVQGGPLTLSTAFTFKADAGAGAAQRASAVLSGSGVLSSQVGVSAYDYDTFGFLSRIQPMGATYDVKQNNDSLGRATSQMDPNGISTAFTWDGASRLTGITPPTPEVGTTITPHNDALGWTVIKGQQATSYRYNRFGQPILERRSTDGGTTWSSFKAYAYDAAGRTVGETIWLSGAGSEEWWNQINLTAPATVLVSFVPGHYECIQEDSLGNCLKRVWVADETTYATSPALAKGVSIQYDSYGREISRTDANGVVTSTSYGPLSKTVTIAPGTSVAMATTFVNDAAGRLIKVVDAKGQVTTYGYDPLDKIVEVRQFPTSSGTGAATLGTGTPQVRQWVYDSLGRTVVLDQPESGVTYSTAFTVTGKPTKSVYGLPRGWRPASVDAEDSSAYAVANTKTLTTTYDALGRVVSVVSNDGSVNHTFAFDEAGRGLSKGKLTTATTGKGVSRQLTYGGLNGRPSALTRVVDGTTFTQGLGWNNDGTLASRTYPDGKVQTLAYDAFKGLPTGTGFNNANLASMAYDPIFWGLNGITFGNNASSFFTYSDDQTRLKSMTHALPTGTLKSWNYLYDSAARLTTDGEDYYAYDALSRLTMAYVRDPWNANAGQGLQQVFTYDAFGNRSGLSSLKVTNWTAGAVPPTTPTTTALTGDPRDLRAYTMTAAEITTMGATNRLPATVGGVATGAAYDALGNLTSLYRTPGSSTTQLNLGYDALGRVATLSDGVNATSQTYLHDDEGLRIKLFDSKTNKTTYNVYNEARQLIATYEKIGTGALTWKKDILYVGTKEVAEVDSANKTWVTFVDHLGSPRLIWDGTANPVKGTNLIEQKFMPFGESLSDPTSASKFAKGFTNHEQTDASGLIYMQARFYAPWFGRFLSPDPARDQHFEDTQTWNIYSYCANDPTMQIDPDGMAPQTPPGGISGKDLLISGAKSFIPVAGGVRQARAAFSGKLQVGDHEIQLSTGKRWLFGVVGCVSAVTDICTLGLDDEITGTLRAFVEAGTLVTTVVTIQEMKKEEDAKADEKAASKPAEEKKGETKPEKAKDRREREKAEAREKKHGDKDYEEPASEERAKHEHKKAEKQSGKEGRREMHDKKAPGERDRSAKQLKEDREQ